MSPPLCRGVLHALADGSVGYFILDLAVWQSDFCTDWQKKKSDTIIDINFSVNNALISTHNKHVKGTRILCMSVRT